MENYNYSFTLFLSIFLVFSFVFSFGFIRLDLAQADKKCVHHHCEMWHCKIPAYMQCRIDLEVQKLYGETK